MPEFVYDMPLRTLEALPQLKARTPVLAGLDPADMRSRGLTAPLHPGAEAAYAIAPPE